MWWKTKGHVGGNYHRRGKREARTGRKVKGMTKGVEEKEEERLEIECSGGGEEDVREKEVKNEVK